MCAKRLASLFIFLLLLGCQPKDSIISTVNTVNDPSAYDNSPYANDISAPNILEDTESDWIYLSFSDPENHEITSCQISNRSFLILSEECVCMGGICKVKVTPSANYFGPASFDYSVTANNLTSPLAHVSFMVLGIQDLPVANDLNISLVENKVIAPSSYVSLGTLSKPHVSGYDPDGDALTCHVVTAPIHSTTFVLNSNCSFVYTPVLDYYGSDSFTFKVKDSAGNDSIPKLVSINVTRYNEPPLANPASVTTYSNKPLPITLSGSDPNGDPLFYYIVQSPSHGTITGSGANITYVPSNNYYGTDSFTFMVSDMFLNSAPATISIDVLKSTLYLSPTGNDATGVISDPTKPFKTAQAAINAAVLFDPSVSTPLIIEVLPGPPGWTYGDIVFNSSFGQNVTWVGGAGATALNTIFGNITANGVNGANGTATIGDWDGKPGGNGHSIRIEADSSMTFGNIIANGGNGGLHFPDPVGQISKPGYPGRGGAIQLKGNFGSITTIGGEGHGSGIGGTVYLMPDTVVSSINASGGQVDLCTVATSCETSVNSGYGGTIYTEPNSTVNGNVISKGGTNNGIITNRMLAGKGGTITVNGTVTGIVESNGGNTINSKVGAGGTITIGTTGVVTGPSISAIAGTGTGAPLGNLGGSIVVSGNATNLFIYSGTYLESYAGTADIFGIVNSINGIGYGTDCNYGRAAIVKIYEQGIVNTNVNLTGGNGSCSPSTAGTLYVRGKILGSAILVGSPLDLISPWDVAGGGGSVFVYAGGDVNDISVQGGNANAGTSEDGGDGGKITLEQGAIIHGISVDASSSTNPLVTAFLIVTGGSGDPPGVNGNDGTVVYPP